MWTFSEVICEFEFCSLLLIPLESNLKLTNHPARAFDLPGTETLPSEGCCSVCHQGIGERKKGGEESDPAISPLSTVVLCVIHLYMILDCVDLPQQD